MMRPDITCPFPECKSKIYEVWCPYEECHTVFFSKNHLYLVFRWYWHILIHKVREFVEA